MFKIPLSVVIPCFNEEEVIELTVEKVNNVLSDVLENFEIVVVDDGSTDNTSVVLDNISKKFEKLKVVRNTKNQGIWSSWEKGTNEASYECIAIFDADLQYQAEDIIVLLDKHIDGSQFVQGVREFSVENNFIRKFISKTLSLWLKMLFFRQTKGLKDIKSGFFVTRKSLLEDIFNFFPNYKYSQTFIAIYANFLNANVQQVKTIFNKRLYGTSFLSNLPFIIIFSVLVESVKVKTKLYGTNYFLLHLNNVTKSVNYENIFSTSEKWRLKFFYKTTFFHKWFIYSNLEKYLDLSLKFDKLSNEEIRKYQIKRLKDLVWYFYQNSLFFKKKCLKSNIHPYQILTLEDLSLLPILTKADIRENYANGLITKTSNFQNIYPISTSGSTGIPLSIFVNKEQLKIRWANTFRAWTWTGWTPSKKQARLWHQTLGMSFFQVIKEFIDNLFFKRIFVPAYNIKKRNIDRYIKKLIKHNPYLIDGYAESFNFLAEYLLKHTHLKFKPKAIISSAQEISDKVKILLNQITGAEIYDKYGSREFSGIAYESTDNKGHLICDDSYIVELLKNKKTVGVGEIGEIFITDLNNYVTPMMRYQIGDLAEKLSDESTKLNKIKFNTLGGIKGRTRAIIVCDESKWVPGTFFAHFFKEYIGRIRQYKVEQFKLGEISIKLVLEDESDDLLDVLDRLSETTGSTKLIVEKVESIPLVRTGKNMGAISYLKNNEILNN